MADIRKRTGAKGTTYQVRYPSASTKSGYAFKSFSTLKEARAFCEDGSARQAADAPAALSVDEGVKIWLDACEKEGLSGRNPVTAYTLKTYRYRAEMIKAYDWPKPLTELAAPDIVQFRSWLLQNYSRDQARKALSYFHSMVLELVSRGAMRHDVASGIGIAKASRYDEPIIIPTEKDIQALLAAADRLANAKNPKMASTWERYRPMLYLAIDSGMRPQEYLVAARSRLTTKGIQVDRALDAGGRKISVPKTRAGRRFIDLSPHTIEMVQHYAKHKSHPNNHDLIFATSVGTWVSSNNWRRRGFISACREAGLVDVKEVDGKEVEVPRYKPYDLRHFYASMLIENKVNLKRIQKLMGHSDIQLTLNVYGHVIERVEWEQEESTQLISSLSKNSCGKSVANPL